MPKPKPPETRRINAPLPLPGRIAGGWRHFADEEIQRLHRLYYDPKVRVSQIALAFGVSTATLLRWIDEMNWPSRRQMKRDAIAAMRDAGRDLRADAPSDAAFGQAAVTDAARAEQQAYTARVGAGLQSIERAIPPDDAPEPEPDVFAGIAPDDFGGLCEAIGEVALRELARARARSGPDAPAQNARTLASLTRTLSTLEDLRKRHARKLRKSTAPERPTRNIDELRAHVAKTLERALGRTQASE